MQIRIVGKFHLVALVFCFIANGLSSGFANQTTASSNLSTIESVKFADLVQTIYSNSFAKKSAHYEFELAAGKKELSAQSYLTTLEVAPSLQSSKQDVSGVGTSEIESRGLRLSVMQETPWGVSLQAGVDRKKFSAASSTAQIENEKSVGVSIDLWKNAFGLQSQALDQARHAEAEADQIQSEIDQRAACEQAVTLSLQYWLASAQHQQALELQKTANTIATTVQKNNGRGVISEVEFLGAKSELLSSKRETLNAEQKREQSMQQILSAIQIEMELKNKAVQGELNEFFKPYLDEVLSAKSNANLKNKSIQIVYEQNLHLAYLAKHAARPSLKLAFKNVQSGGQVAAVDFSQEDRVLELALKMNFNDNLNNSAEVDAQTRLLKAELEYAQARKNSESEFFQLQKQLKSRVESLELQEKQAELLGRIQSEYQTRFLQGRINYQEYLRQKQSWSQMRSIVLTESVDIWKSVTQSYLDLQSSQNFCENL